MATLDPERVLEGVRLVVEELGASGLPRSRAQPLGGLRCAPQLARAGLLDDRGRARFRVNLIGERAFVTDVPELTRHGGVFPYEDEAARLLGYLHERDLEPVDTAIDVGMGCGHLLLAIDAERRVGIDVSARAGALMGLNARINGQRARWVQADAARALAQLAHAGELGGRDRGRSLIVGNLPHAPVPADCALARFAHGGRTGAEVIEAVLAALARHAPPGAEIVLLCYSLEHARGGADVGVGAGGLLVPSLAERLLPGRQVAWTPLTGAAMWRVAGSMSEVSPMALATGLPRKADCPYYVDPSARESVRSSYERLAAQLRSEGWDRLAYGVLHISPVAP